jgi:hypothetical protein
LERRTPLKSYGYNSALRDPVMDAELGDSTGSMKLVQDRTGSDLLRGFWRPTGLWQRSINC